MAHIPSETVLGLMIQEFIKQADLSTVTEKMLRRALEKELRLPDLALDEQKNLIARLLSEKLSDLDGEPSHATASTSESAGKKRKIEKLADSDGPQVNDDGTVYWEIGKSKRITVSEFKGRTLVQIREYWKNDEGEMKPGKKGIALTPEQWKRIVEISEQVSDKI